MIFFPLFSIFVLSLIVFAVCAMREEKSRIVCRVETSALVTTLVSFGSILIWVMTESMNKIG
jgi:hypothetical protein